MFTSDRETEAKGASAAVFLTQRKTEEQLLKKMSIEDYNGLTEKVLGY